MTPRELQFDLRKNPDSPRVHGLRTAVSMPSNAVKNFRMETKQRLATQLECSEYSSCHLAMLLSRPQGKEREDSGCISATRWTNPETGKGWAPEEESAFAEIMAAGGIARLAAIRLYRRMVGNLGKALRYAREVRALKAQRSASLVRARNEKRLKGQPDRENRSLPHSPGWEASNHTQDSPDEPETAVPLSKRAAAGSDLEALR